jgi:hypothetical protein
MQTSLTPQVVKPMGATLSNLCQGTRLHFHVTTTFVTAVIYTSSLLEIVLELETEEMENRLIV